MHKNSSNGDARDGNLAWQALLYASGELDPVQAAVFEERLGNDQAAREALSRAAPLAHEPAPGAGAWPNPAYRDHVRERLGRGAGLWQWLWGKRAYRGHPLVWVLGGAAAAVLFMMAFHSWPCVQTGDAQPSAVGRPSGLHLHQHAAHARANGAAGCVR